MPKTCKRCKGKGCCRCGGTGTQYGYNKTTGSSEKKKKCPRKGHAFVKQGYRGIKKG